MIALPPAELLANAEPEAVLAVDLDGGKHTEVARTLQEIRAGLQK